MPEGRFPQYALTDYSKIDSGLNKQGKYVACLCSLDHIDNWQHLTEEEYRTKKEAWQEALLDHLNEQFPGIKGAIIFREMRTARAMQDYLNTPGGAIFGFERTTPFLPGRPPTARTSMKGLYLASAFGTHGGGFTGALLSGDAAAKRALADE